MDIESDDAGQRHELGEQTDEVWQAETRGREDHDVEVAPDHQTGDVAARVVDRAGPGQHLVEPPTPARAVRLRLRRRLARLERVGCRLWVHTRVDHAAMRPREGLTEPD